MAELRAPVAQEALRLRMVALHGREDALLDAGRFPRLLRQANDAEVADVRKVGDDEYEISRASVVRLAPLCAPAAPRRGAATVGAHRRSASSGCRQLPGQRENGQRSGSGSVGARAAPRRGGEIPLIGVVQIEAPPEQPQAREPAGTPAATELRPRLRRRRRPNGRGRGAPEASRCPGQAAAAAPTAEARGRRPGRQLRPSARERAARKKAE